MGNILPISTTITDFLANQHIDTLDNEDLEDDSLLEFAAPIPLQASEIEEGISRKKLRLIKEQKEKEAETLRQTQKLIRDKKRRLSLARKICEANKRLESKKMYEELEEKEFFLQNEKSKEYFTGASIPERDEERVHLLNSYRFLNKEEVNFDRLTGK